MRLTLFFLFIFSLFVQQDVFGQNETFDKQAAIYYEKGESFFRSRDYEKALEYYREAVAIDKQNCQYQTRYAHAFFLNNQVNNAAIILDRATRLPSVTENCYQLCCQVFSVRNEFKLAKKYVDDGIEKFPKSGLLYNEKAKLYSSYRDDTQAEENWMKAIQVQPSFLEPYYLLAKLYDTASDKTPNTLFLLENYLLANPQGVKAKEAKILLYRCFANLQKTLFVKNKNTAPVAKKKDADASIAKTYYRILKANKYHVSSGANVDNITQWRASAVRDWETLTNIPIPNYILFQKRIMHEQLFDVYNQWLFGEAAKPAKYAEWKANNEKSIDLLISFLNENPYTP
jgi:tetratricopeptide (TPR) repeat protein